MLVPITLFLVIGAIVIVPQILRSRDRQRVLDTMRAAYERGQEPAPELIAAVSRSGRPAEDFAALDQVVTRSTDRDLRRGVGWTAVGVGLLLIGGIGYATQYEYGGSVEWMNSFAALAAIPLCVGLAFLALWRFSRPKPTV